MATPSDQPDKKSGHAVHSWLWPPRPFTFAVAGCVPVVAFFACFPAVDAPHAGLHEGKYGHHFELESQYEHGWPLRYCAREEVFTATAAVRRSPWTPWDEPSQWSTWNLVGDIAIWSALLMLTAVAAQWWRAQRRAFWQLYLRDYLAFTGIFALVFAWLGYERSEYLRERRLTQELQARPGKSTWDNELAATVPAWLPVSVQEHYRQMFSRVGYFYSAGDTDLACQHRHVLVLSEHSFHRDFLTHLRQMSQLEGMDLMMAGLPYFDATEQATILRGLPAMPSLRGINLYESNATDADMIWLAKCRRVEVIELYGVPIGNEGIEHLKQLPKLRWIRLTSDRITNKGCRHLAEFPALTELTLASRNITDEGVRELLRLKMLRELHITASASEGAFVDLQKALPDCEVHATSDPAAD